MKHSCPHCGEEIVIDFRAISAPHAVKMTITPEEGRWITAKTVAGVIDKTADLLAARSERLGFPCEVGVRSMGVRDDGTHELDFVVCLIADAARPAAPGEGGEDG